MRPLYRSLIMLCIGTLALSASVVMPAQVAMRAGSNPAPPRQDPARRTRLILKDGSYQVVLSYKVVGARVQFISAERVGETEEIPLTLVDLDATKSWELKHADPSIDANSEQRRSPVPEIDPEVLKEEAERRSFSPEVATELRLVPEDSVLALDTFHAMPELVPLMQSAGDLNKETGHSIVRGVLNPGATTHQLVELKGERAAVQLHVNDPGFYLRTDDDAAPTGEVFHVETQGASSSAAVKERRREPSRYAIVRVDVRRGVRVVASFNPSSSASARRQEDVIQTSATLLPGGHWTKLVPTENLLFGEYCLVELLGENQVNLSVWDFGVHPTAPENRDVIRPEKKTGLGQRATE